MRNSGLFKAEIIVLLCVAILAGLAFDYNNTGQYEEAITEWKHLIELEPEIARLHALLADVYLQTG